MFCVELKIKLNLLYDDVISVYIFFSLLNAMNYTNVLVVETLKSKSKIKSKLVVIFVVVLLENTDTNRKCKIQRTNLLACFVRLF